MVYFRASLVTQTVKNLCAVQETRVPSLSWEDLLEKGMATHSRILAWRIPWTEEPGGLHSPWFISGHIFPKVPSLESTTALLTFFLEPVALGWCLCFGSCFSPPYAVGHQWVCLILSLNLWALWGWGSHSVWLIMFDPWLVSRNYCFWTGSG